MWKLATGSVPVARSNANIADRMPGAAPRADGWIELAVGDADLGIRPSVESRVRRRRVALVGNASACGEIGGEERSRRDHELRDHH